MNTTLAALAKYLAVLEQSADGTLRTEDRTAYTRHLAEAARFFRAAYAGDTAGLRALVASEQRAYGWAYLSYAEGAAAELAFNEFAAYVAGFNAT